MRFQKKKAGGVAACFAHNERKKETYKSNPDIDSSRRSDNYYLVLPKQTYRRETRRMIQEADCKIRSNSTVMVETLITGSPEFMNALPPPEQREFFQRALQFMESKIGRENIIAAVVHMDEKTPHMHLSFCPITEDKRLSAKSILGNQAQLSRWQTDYHNAMSSRWPELERGLSSMETGRKHIPLSLFKQAERLDKQVAAVESALANISPLNAKKQREKALELLTAWLPQAERFTAQIKKVDGYIKSLESESGYQKRRNDDLQQTLHLVRSGKEEDEWKHYREMKALEERLRRQERLLKQIPPEIMAQYNNTKKERSR
jgi:hypothetical protein